MWFKCNARSCQKCGVMFKPESSEWYGDELCREHRRPFIQELDRRQKVLDWTFDEWKLVESFMNGVKEQDLFKKHYLGDPKARYVNAAEAAKELGRRARKKSV